MPLVRRQGFTLLELCLAMLIGFLLITLAVPSIGGLIAEQRLKESFERFDRLVANAKTESSVQQQTCVLAWEKDGITLRSATPAAPGVDAGKPTRLVFEDGESFQLRRPAALLPNAKSEWSFWSNGLCEPAVIAFHGKSGSWLVRYDPLTARGTFLESATP